MLRATNIRNCMPKNCVCRLSVIFRRFRRSEIFLSMEFWKKKLKFEWISNFPLQLGTFYPIKFRQCKQLYQCISDFENNILNAFPTFVNWVLVFFKVTNLFIFITTLITKKTNTFMNCHHMLSQVLIRFSFWSILYKCKQCLWIQGFW